MCTVTFIPANDHCFITSSRDENAARPQAIAPGIYKKNGFALLYPKDAAACGSWIALNENGNMAVLLNGAFIKHEPKPPYRKSRGLVFLDIIAHPQPNHYFAEIDLANIEPFTVVLLVNRCLYECRWDGAKKHDKQLDETKTHIWSSATLYSPAATSKRNYWFNKWLTETGSPTQEDIFNFHRLAGDGDSTNSVLMNRGGELLTVSITGIVLNNGKGTMHYFNVLNNKAAFNTMEFAQVVH